MGTKGFVTLAVGNRKYYELAKNLLQSYKFHTKQALPFAIVCDKENEITELFDTVIILNNPSCSYMDKIEMIANAPYDENIFIDADCLAYKDVNVYWDYFEGRGGVRCFGHKLPLGSSEGWFTLENIGAYREKVKFQLGMHGGIIYFANDELTSTIYTLSKLIAEHYGDYQFAYFEKPADEPIMALAMAVCDCPPVEWSAMDNRAYLFYPTAKECKFNILTGDLAYTNDGNTWKTDVFLMHWQNRNTESPAYMREIYRLETGENPRYCFYKWIQLKFFCKNQFNKLKNQLMR